MKTPESERDPRLTGKQVDAAAQVLATAPEGESWTSLANRAVAAALDATPSPDGTLRERDEAVEWIGTVRDELVRAGYPAGDRTVALANIRALLASAPEPREPDGWVNENWRRMRENRPVIVYPRKLPGDVPVYIGAQPAPQPEVTP